jgi:hypothetical protein
VAEVLYYAIPAFVLLLVMELLSFKYRGPGWSPDGSGGGTRG